VASSWLFEPVVTIHCLAALDLGAGFEQPFIDSSSRTSGRVVHVEVDELDRQDNMVDGLFFCATLTGRRRGHTPFVQVGAGTSDTGAKAVMPDPRSPWQGQSRRVSAGVGVKSTESRRAAQPLHIPYVIRPDRPLLLLLSDELMSCCAAGMVAR